MAKSIIIHREDEQKFGHRTFYKKGPPGHPETEVLCNVAEAAALDALARAAENELRRQGLCSGSSPPPSGSGSSGSSDENQLPEGVI